MLNKALFLKYSSSQNYYYTKDVQELVDGTRKPHVVTFKDQILLEENEEYLTRIYKVSEHKGKIQYLTEYYKYHKEVPRLFMTPASSTINHFHDKKRRIEYYKIKKMLAEQKKGVIVTGNQEERGLNSSDSSMENSKHSKGIIEKPISRILELLETSLNREKDQETNRKRFTINKSIKSKLQNVITTEKPDKPTLKDKKNPDNSLGSLRELNGFLEKLVMRPRVSGVDDDDLKTLIPTEMSDIFFEETGSTDALKKVIIDSARKTKECKISLENNSKEKQMTNSPKGGTLLNFRKNSAPKPALPPKTNNFLSPKNPSFEKLALKKNTNLLSEKILEKFVPLELNAKSEGMLLNKQDPLFTKHEMILSKPQGKESDAPNFKKKKSYSITSSAKEKDVKAEAFFRKILEKDQKNPKFFSPEKPPTEKSPEMKLFNESKLKKVEKFIKIYKNTVNLQKMPSHRETSQTRAAASLTNPVKEQSDTLHNLSKMSNSKSFSEKQSGKHRRINSMNPRNVLKKYQNEVPLEKVQEILFKGTKNSGSTTGLKVHNNNTLHRKMPSDMCTPKDLSQKPRVAALQVSEGKFLSGQVMSRSQVNNQIKGFGSNTMHFKENLTEAKKGRNKSLEGGRKQDTLILMSNYTSKNSINAGSKRNLKEGGTLIGNLKQTTRENVNPATGIRIL